MMAKKVHHKPALSRYGKSFNHRRGFHTMSVIKARGKSRYTVSIRSLSRPIRSRIGRKLAVTDADWPKAIYRTILRAVDERR